MYMCIHKYTYACTYTCTYLRIISLQTYDVYVYKYTYEYEYV